MKNPMKKSISSALVLVLVLVQSAQAQMTIEQLVERTGVAAGETAIRDTDRWSGVEQILVRQGLIDLASARQAYPDVEFVAVRSSRDAMQMAATANAYLGNCDANFIAAANNLLWVQITSAGVERCIDIPKIANGDVVLTNMQKMDSPVIAEHAIAMMMSLARNLPSYVRHMEDGAWSQGKQERGQMYSIVNKKLLVVGLGGIGTEIARFGAALGMQVSATRNSSRTGPDFVQYVGLSDELHKLAAEADVIISALPLTESTTNLFDAEFFAVLQPGTMFVNVGRGKSVVTADLVAALRSGKLSGVGLDVTEPEPLPSNHVLWSFTNVVISPPVSSGGRNADRRTVLVQENLRRFVAGDALLNSVDPERGY